MIVALDARVEVAGVLLSFDLGDPMSFLYLKVELTKNLKLDKTLSFSEKLTTTCIYTGLTSPARGVLVSGACENQCPGRTDEV